MPWMMGEMSVSLASSSILQVGSDDRNRDSMEVSTLQKITLPTFWLADANNVRQSEEENSLEQKTLEQKTSVTQLSDVEPTDWAYSALKSLVERYGCVTGYFDKTFQGHRSITRSETAAILNACAKQLDSHSITKSDSIAFHSLQAEFEPELAALEGRVEALEAQTTSLETQQFSTTSKLQGKATFVGQFSGILGNNFVNPTTGQSVSNRSLRPNVLSSIQLDFNTSFRGDDLLQTSIAAGNGGQDAFTDLGLLNYPDASGNAGRTTFASLGTNALAGFPTTFYLYRLAYSFVPVKNVSLTVGPQLYPADFLDFNSYGNNYYSDFSSYVFVNNPLTMPFALNFLGGAGGALDWKISEPLSFRAVYVAASATNAVSNTDGGGLFGDPYQATVELEYRKTFKKNDSNNFTARLQYTNSATNDVSQNAFGLNLETTFGRFGLFGRIGYSFANAYGTAIAPLADRKFSVQTWTAGVAVRDILFPGSLFAGAVGQPFLSNLPATSTFGSNTASQTNYEAFFRIPIGDRISVTPGIMLITEPNNTAGQSSLIQGYIRTTFSF
jgi:Carbohydrate-selective porin, OprB family/S-layer homology domain